MFAKVMCLWWVAVLAVLGQTQAGVMRIDSASNVAVQRAELNSTETTTAATAHDIAKPKVLTEAKEENNENQPTEEAVSRDEDESVKLAPASLDPAPGTLEGVEFTLVTVTPNQAEEDAAAAELEEETSTLNIPVEEAAFSRDEDASVKIAVDAAPDTQDTEVVFSSAESNQKLEKSAKLLLLSTPKISERNREQEENIDQPDEFDSNTDATDAGETTELSVELAEEKKQGEEEKTVDVETKKQADSEQEEESAKKPQSKEEGESFITRLFGIRDSIFDTKPLPSQHASPTAEPGKLDESDESKKVADNNNSTDSTSAAATKAEEPTASHNDNVASSVLIETESDYVLVDADAEQWGSFTHADSEVHLQPIVQSVEVVPTHFDEPLLVSYVHAW